MFKFMSNNANKLFCSGILMIILALTGIWIGNLYETIPYSGDNIFLKELGSTYKYPYDYLIIPSAIVGLIGILEIIPMLLKWTLKASRVLWRLFKQALYEIVYEVSRAIQDGKTRN